MEVQWIGLLFWLVIAAATALCVFCFAMAIRDYRRCKASGGRLTAAQKYAEPVVKTVKTMATVIDQACRVRMKGMRMPESVKEFIIVFQTEHGEVLKLYVPEELYDGLQRGQRGMLTTVDGELYSFELD